MTRRRWWLLAAALVALALAASANGLLNGFTYDDRFVVLLNPRAHTLHGWWRAFAQSYWPAQWGGDGYRPLKMLSFMLEWRLGHGAPWVFHAVNVALYCVASVLVFWVGSMFLPEAGAWVAAALFAVHPVHVEAVANVVGQEEISCAVMVLLAVGIYLRARQRGALTWRTMSLIALLYTLGCFFKEHAIVLPALLIAAEATVVRDERPLGRRLFVTLRPFWLLLAMFGCAFLLVRSRVLVNGITGFQPFVVFETLNLSYANRVLTMFGVVPQWIRLLLWPAHLSSEYAPPYIDVAQGPEVLQLPGLLLLIGVLGVAALSFRRRPIVAFGVAWLCIALLPSSNFILPAGIILAERTLFLPSVGAMFLLGAAVPWLAERLVARRAQLAAVAALGCIVVLGAWRSFDRTKVWHDNETLMRQAVQDSPLMYRTHYMLGAVLFEQHRMREAESEYRKALQLFPYDPALSFSLAEQYRQFGVCPFALPLYQWSYAVAPNFHEGMLNYAYCLLVTNHYATARQEALDAMRFGGPLKKLRVIVAAADSAMKATGHSGAPVDSSSMAALMQQTKAVADSAVRADQRRTTRGQ